MWYKKFLILMGLTVCVLHSGITQGQSKSLDLHDLIHLALRKNADIQVQQSEKHIARLKMGQSFTQLLPQADAEAAYAKSSAKGAVPNFVAANGTIEKIAWISIDQPLFDPDRILEVMNTKVEREKQSVIMNKTRQDVIMQVIRAYFNALQARGEIRVYRENLNAFQLLYKQTKLLYKNGLVPQLDVKKSRVEYLLQKNVLALAGKNYLAALNYIKELVGIPISDSLSISDFTARQTTLDSLSNYLKLALVNRPEIKILQLQGHQYVNVKRFTYLKHFPSVNLTAYYGWDTNDRLQALDRGWQINVNLQMPLWHWGRLHFDRQISSLRYRQTQVLEKQLRKQIVQQVTNTYNECRIQLQQMKAMRESVADAKEAVRMARLGYKAGTVTNLDVINTQKLFTETKVNYLLSIYNFYIARARLYRNMGRLTEDFSWLK